MTNTLLLPPSLLPSSPYSPPPNKSLFQKKKKSHCLLSTEIKPCLGAAPAGSQRPRAAGRWRTRAAQAAARAGPGGVPPPPPRPPPTSPPASRANCWMLYWDRGLGGRKREWEAGKRGRECGSEYTKPPGSRGPGARRPPPTLASPPFPSPPPGPGR